MARQPGLVRASWRRGGQGDAPATLKFLLQVANAAAPNAQAMGALATGLLKNATGTGVQSIAAAGVDFAKGPWKVFSTVRNVGAAQTLSIPVVDGEGNGLIRATGILLSDGTDRSITPKINGSATNVKQQEVWGSNSSVAALRDTSIGSTGTYGAFFDLVMHTSTKSGTLKRFGSLKVATASTTLAVTIYVAEIHFVDAATTITSIDIDCGNPTGLAANTYALVEEGIVG